MQAAMEEAQMVWETRSMDFGPPFKKRMSEYLETGERPKLPAPEGLPDDWWELSQMERDQYHAESEREQDDRDDAQANSDLSLGLPLDHMDLRCACEQAGCQARVSFEAEGGSVRLKFDKVSDHFVMSAKFMATLALDVDPEIGGD
jgi:hypothetical protein